MLYKMIQLGSLSPILCRNKYRLGQIPYTFFCFDLLNYESSEASFLIFDLTLSDNAFDLLISDIDPAKQKICWGWLPFTALGYEISVLETTSKNTRLTLILLIYLI